MEFKEIQDLIKMANKYNIADLKIEKKEFKIQIRTVHGAGPKSIITSPSGAMDIPSIPLQTTAAAPSGATGTEQVPTSAATTPATEESTSANPNHITVKSPIIGTFYRASGPDKDPFVKVGDTISQGDVVCIIEAMKLFNEIESEHSGRIVEVLLDDASPVEYDQPLFIIDPS